jgi:hypothetical protein
LQTSAISVLLKRSKGPEQGGLVGILRVSQHWGVYIVHTSGFGSGRIWVGSGRIPHVSGRAHYSQGLESGSSPTSGTCFPCSGACEPLSVHKLFTCGPFRGLFWWWPVMWPRGSVLGVDDGSAFLPLHGGVGPRLHDLSQVGDVRSWRSIRHYRVSWMTFFWFRHGGLCRPQWNRD